MLEFNDQIRIKKILDEVQPFLIGKSKQANILRECIELPRQTNENRLKLNAMRSRLYRDIRSMNKRGLAEN